MELIEPNVAGLAACCALQTGVKPSHTHALVGILCDQGVQRLRQGGGPLLLLDGDRPALAVVAHPFGVGWMSVRTSILMLHSLRLRLYWRSWPCESDQVVDASGEVAQETLRLSRAISRHAFEVVTGLRIDAYMDAIRDSDAAASWPQTEMTGSAVGDQPVDPAVDPTLARPGRAGGKPPRHERMSGCDRESGTRKSHRRMDSFEAPTASCAPVRSTSRRSAPERSGAVAPSHGSGQRPR